MSRRPRKCSICSKPAVGYKPESHSAGTHPIRIPEHDCWQCADHCLLAVWLSGEDPLGVVRRLNGHRFRDR